MPDIDTVSSTASHIAYFGYGSLVNLATLRTPYVAAYPATLKGWRRVWLTRPAVAGSFAPEEGLAFLSVEPDANSEIDGLVVIDHAASLPSLDERESLYDRHTLDRAELTIQGGDDKLCGIAPYYLYVAQKVSAVGSPSPYILRSYLDAVSQGFLTHFGSEGLRRFKETTANFHYQIREDRLAPIYPRSVELSAEEDAAVQAMFPMVTEA